MYVSVGISVGCVCMCDMCARVCVCVHQCVVCEPVWDVWDSVRMCDMCACLCASACGV